MARLARAEVFASDEVAIVHVMNRVTRRCFLLGDDPVTGQNYDHRKQWIDDQLVHQARHFGIDLLCQAIMSNHIHLVLRSRPDVVAEWDDTEVARRWLMLCPASKDDNGQPLKPTEFELNHIRNDKEKLADIRSRLSDISWWMRLLSQNIAQRANKEDDELGKFWQARFRAVRLLDETAILACAAYVDLNPIRAAMAETIETSDFTSAQKRTLDLQAQESSAVSKLRCGQHLAPVDLHERSGKTGPSANKRNQRCSNKGFLPMSTADYLSLLDWTAGQTVACKQGSTPQHLAPIFDRLGITSEMWCRLVKDFGRLFSLVAGQSQCIDEHRSQSSSHRYRTRKDTRELLASA
jgi:hypothetical protein